MKVVKGFVRLCIYDTKLLFHYLLVTYSIYSHLK